MELMVLLLFTFICILIFWIGAYLSDDIIRPAMMRRVIDALKIDEIDFYKADRFDRVHLLEEKYKMQAELLMTRAMRITHQLTQSGALHTENRNEIIRYIEEAIYKLRTGEAHLIIFKNVPTTLATPLHTLIDVYNTDTRSLQRVSQQLCWLIPQIFFTARLYPQKLG